MSNTFITLAKLIKYAFLGRSIKDKYLAFLTSSIGVMGSHRANLRHKFLEIINSYADNNFVDIKIDINKEMTHLSMRYKNEADYLMTGELIRGGYKLPDFEPKLIIDGGANIGMFAVQAIRFFPNADVICYEPDSHNFQHLTRNLSLNSLDAEVHQLGLWSKSTTLYYHAQSSETGFIDENPPGIAIPCILPEIKADCRLKLDIEGAEYQVIPALLNNGQYARWISMEVHDFNTKGASLLDLLRNHGYTVECDADANVSCTVISAYRN